VAPLPFDNLPPPPAPPPARRRGPKNPTLWRAATGHPGRGLQPTKPPIAGLDGHELNGVLLPDFQTYRLCEYGLD
jgi:hypothetical protein